MADPDPQAIGEGGRLVEREARQSARLWLEQRPVTAVVLQMVVQVQEQLRQLFPGQGVNLQGGDSQRARAIRIFWMSLVPS